MVVTMDFTDLVFFTAYQSIVGNLKLKHISDCKRMFIVPGVPKWSLIYVLNGFNTAQVAMEEYCFVAEELYQSSMIFSYSLTCYSFCQNA